MTTLADLALVQALAEALISEADKVGVIVTITREPMQPLRMGNHTPVITTWPADRSAPTPAPLQSSMPPAWPAHIPDARPV